MRRESPGGRQEESSPYSFWWSEADLDLSQVVKIAPAFRGSQSQVAPPVSPSSSRTELRTTRYGTYKQLTSSFLRCLADETVPDAVQRPTYRSDSDCFSASTTAKSPEHMGKPDATLAPLLVGRTCPHPHLCAASRSYITWPSDLELRCPLVSVQRWEGRKTWPHAQTASLSGKKVADSSMSVAIRKLPRQTLRESHMLCLCPGMWPSTP